MEKRRLRLKLLSVAKPPPSSAAEAPLLNKLGGRRWGPCQIAGAVLFGVNSAIGYCLMLAVMSFNALMRRSPESASMRNAVVERAAEVSKDFSRDPSPEPSCFCSIGGGAVSFSIASMFSNKNYDEKYLPPPV
ncbi:uncharacterized protein LOC125210367 [Salvia hispanica]|uniref:uncharacterized protein LOC125210367 n=1 Tax=Salvia hispanica TaxID=49212 RepID=UPI0020090B47|nr:uncharacterized protein LOC125210367 [Salvia hispanica]